MPSRITQRLCPGGPCGGPRPCATRASSSCSRTISSPTARWRTCSPACRKGASGVLAGNFQVVAEDVMPRAAAAGRHRRCGGDNPAPVDGTGLAASASGDGRSTLSAAPSGHQRGQNRLFWRVDGDTLIGPLLPAAHDRHPAGGERLRGRLRLRLFLHSRDVPLQHGRGGHGFRRLSGRGDAASGRDAAVAAVGAGCAEDPGGRTLRMDDRAPS